MSKKVYPSEVRLFARGCYVQGNSLTETAKLVKKQYPESRCNAETIRRWATSPEDSWDAARERVRSTTGTNQESSIATVLEEHANLYQLAIDKGKAGLQAKGMVPRTATEAGSLLDMGIRGQRSSLKELLELNFVREVFRIVVEEVVDEMARRRIAFRLRELSRDWKGDGHQDEQEHGSASKAGALTSGALHES